MARRNNPFDDLEEMLNRMSRQFRGMGQEFEDASGGWSAGGTSLDVADHDDSYVVTADLPGFETDDIDVSLRDDRLVIDAQRQEQSEEDDEQYLRQERTQRSVSRTVTLPGRVNEDDVSAEYHNGVLTVTLPKAGDEDSHSIDIG